MKAWKNWVGDILQRDGVEETLIGKQPLVEVVGMRRVLIENHRCIALYEPTEIDIYVAGGRICVMGSGLTLAYMSKEHIVIRGEISNLTFCKEGRG